MNRTTTRALVGRALMATAVGLAALVSTAPPSPAEAPPATPAAEQTETPAKEASPLDGEAINAPGDFPHWLLPELANHATLRCLDDSYYGLRTYECNGGTWQMWNYWFPSVFPWPSVVVLQNRGTGRCLDDSVYGLRTYECNGGTWQMWNWRLSPTGALWLQNRGTGRCLDDSNEFGLRGFHCNWLQWQTWS